MNKDTEKKQNKLKDKKKLNEEEINKVSGGVKWDQVAKFGSKKKN